MGGKEGGTVAGQGVGEAQGCCNLVVMAGWQEVKCLNESGGRTIAAAFDFWSGSSPKSASMRLDSCLGVR